MTVGDGIFWSTILLVAFASIVLITKSKRWKTFFKVLAILVALGVVVGVGIWGYFKYENRPQVMSSLNGIRLGMSEVDVTLQKGEPDHVSEIDAAPDGSRKLLLFKGSSDSYTYAILRGKKDSMVVTDICDKGGYGRVLGFGEYSSENAVLEKLGKPSNLSINENGTGKLLSYPQWNAAFEVERGNIVKACVTNRPQMRYSTEYGETKRTKEEE